MLSWIKKWILSISEPNIIFKANWSTINLDIDNKLNFINNKLKLL